MKVAVIYWSGSGNTEAMADAFVDAIAEAGGSADKYFCGDFETPMMPNYDAFAFGCPAQGTEELEPIEFYPTWWICKDKFEGKPVILFGSYGWGGGEYLLKTWKAEADESNVNVVATVVANGPADDAVIAEIKAAAKALA